MPLAVIKGPPNSGRTELVREQFESRLRDDPVLVVPSSDDVLGWERRLTRAREDDPRGVFLGGRVLRFADLVKEILVEDEDFAWLKNDVEGRIASPLRRRALATDALRGNWGIVADRIERQPGLVDATLRLIDELRENLIDPDTLEERSREADGQVPAELAPTYRSYLGDLASAELFDLPQLAAESAKIPLDGWAGRPVFVAGFDDLTELQLVLLTRLSRVTDVSIAITHEPENRAMAVTERLLGRLQHVGGQITDVTNRPAHPIDHEPLLFELERCFHDRRFDRALAPGDSLTLMFSSGRRGEAEAVGAEIAGLIADGVSPGQIAIAVDVPATNGLAFRDVLAEYDVAASLEAETEVTGTAVGQAALNLLRAANGGEPSDLLAYMRGPLGIDQAAIDAVEFEARREGIEKVDELAGKFRERLGEPPGWDRVRGREAGSVVKEVVRRAALNLIAAEPGLPGPAVQNEAQMSTAIGKACDDLAKLHGEGISASQLIEALTSGDIKTWAVPTADTVKIASPYSMRAKRVQHLFLVSLQERSLGDESGPFLTPEARRGLRLPEMTDEEDQELYLFYSCLSVPTTGLWLSTRTADVHGKTEFPSPMIEEVVRLFDESESKLRRRRRSGSDIVFAADRSPTLTELTLSVAAGARLPELPAAESGEIAARLARAEATDERTAVLGPLDMPPVLAALGANGVFSATALESFIECPYRWFFDRALTPTRFGPEPEALARGTLIHEVLAEVFAERPGRLPRPEDVEEWIASMEVHVETFANRSDIGLGSDSAPHRLDRARVKTDLARYLRREAARPESAFVPTHLEQDFGFGDESAPAVEFGGWSLRGRIDRIDVAETGNGPRGIVFDYKSGATSFKNLAEMRREGKVQLHLYLEAMRSDWGIGPAAGLYLPIYRGDGRPRGLINEADWPSLAGLRPFKSDVPDDFGEELRRGLAAADLAAAGIRGGSIAHGPEQCLNHFHHAGVPDWEPDDED